MRLAWYNCDVRPRHAVPARCLRTKWAQRWVRETLRNGEARLAPPKIVSLRIGEPTAASTDAIVAHPVGMLGLAWDHRAFDGAYASAFLAKIKEVLETRNWSEEF